MKKLLLSLFILLSVQLQAQCWKEVAAGFNHSVAIKDDGTLWAWGDSSNGQFISNGYNISPISPETDWSLIDAGEFHSMAIKTDGTLWTWGANYLGQLGNGNSNSINVPTKVGTDNDWMYVSGKVEHVAAIKTNGTLWSWGENNFWQLGHNTPEYVPFYTVPTQVGTDTNWKMASTGVTCILAIKTDGTLWAMGTNSSGMFGNGTVPSPGDNNYYFKDPVQIGTDTDWKFISAGNGFTAAIKTDGTLWTWGNNLHGQLGDGTTNSRSLPAQIGTDTWKSVTCSIYVNSLCGGIKTDGTL